MIEDAQTSNDLEAKTAKAQRGVDQDVAALEIFFAAYIPRFDQMVSKLSSRQLKRLLKGIITYALPTNQYEHKNALEAEAFNLATQLLYSKYRVAFLQELTQLTESMEKENKNVGNTTDEQQK